MSATIKICHTHGDRHYVTDSGHAVVNVELPDGRNVDLIVREDGGVTVRAYVSRPMVTGNQEALRADFHLPTLSGSMAGDQVELTTLSTHAVTLRDVIVPDTENWAHADSADRTISTLLRRDLATAAAI